MRTAQGELDAMSLRDEMLALRCGDNSCVFGSSGGMGTNGGCRCFENTPVRERQKAHRAAHLLQEALRQETLRRVNMRLSAADIRRAVRQADVAYTKAGGTGTSEWVRLFVEQVGAMSDAGTASG